MRWGPKCGLHRAKKCFSGGQPKCRKQSPHKGSQIGFRTEIRNRTFPYFPIFPPAKTEGLPRNLVRKLLGHQFFAWPQEITSLRGLQGRTCSNLCCDRTGHSLGVTPRFTACARVRHCRPRVHARDLGRYCILVLPSRHGAGLAPCAAAPSFPTKANRPRSHSQIHWSAEHRCFIGSRSPSPAAGCQLR